MKCKIYTIAGWYGCRDIVEGISSVVAVVSGVKELSRVVSDSILVLPFVSDLNSFRVTCVSSRRLLGRLILPRSNPKCTANAIKYFFGVSRGLFRIRAYFVEWITPNLK